MSEIAGRIIKGDRCWEYQSTIHGDQPFCHDFTRIVTGKRSKLARVTPSWGGGVDDDGAKRMAIAMLYLSYAWCNGCWDEDKIKATAKQYYKQYAKEVVAHLPERWTMSGEQIMKWIRKQERKRKKK